MAAAFLMCLCALTGRLVRRWNERWCDDEFLRAMRIDPR